MKWFLSIKACINTIMVHTGWKKKQKFKVTLKRGENEGDRTQGFSQALSNFKLHQIHDALSEVRHVLRWIYCTHSNATYSVNYKKQNRIRASQWLVKHASGAFQPSPADSLPHSIDNIRFDIWMSSSQKKLARYSSSVCTQVTDKRKSCMPFDGTLDVWVILFITGAACRPAPPDSSISLPASLFSLRLNGIPITLTPCHAIIQYSNWRSLWTAFHITYNLVPKVGFLFTALCS